MTNLFLKMPEEKPQEYKNDFSVIKAAGGITERMVKETFSLNDKKTLNYYIQLAKNYFGTIIIPRKKSVNVTPKTAHLDLSKKDE